MSFTQSKMTEYEVKRDLVSTPSDELLKLSTDQVSIEYTTLITLQNDTLNKLSIWKFIKWLNIRLVYD